MKIHKSTEMTLDHFLKLPRRAQLIFFEHMEDSMIRDGDVSYCNYSVSGAFHTEDCKSPIEQMLAVALNVYSERYPFDFECQRSIRTSNGEHYYADFAILKFDDEDDYGKVVVLVECDGHEFHEKTKAQVARRNKRDYNLKADGYDILHYSGSQIYDDPFKCAKEIYEYCIKRLEMRNDV